MDIHSCHVVQPRSCAVQLGPGQPKGSALESWCLVVYIYILFVTTANLWPPRSLRIYTRIHIYFINTYINIYIYISIRFVLHHIAGMHTARLYTCTAPQPYSVWQVLAMQALPTGCISRLSSSQQNILFVADVCRAEIPAK